MAPYEILNASDSSIDGTCEVVLRAAGLAAVHDLANALTAAPWHESKAVGHQVAEQTGVRIQPEVLDLNAQIENWKHLRHVADERNRLEHEELRRIADACDGSYPIGCYEVARRLRLVLSGEYVREVMTREASRG